MDICFQVGSPNLKPEKGYEFRCSGQDVPGKETPPFRRVADRDSKARRSKDGGTPVTGFPKLSIPGMGRLIHKYRAALSDMVVDTIGLLKEGFEMRGIYCQTGIHENLKSQENK